METKHWKIYHNNNTRWVLCRCIPTAGWRYFLGTYVAVGQIHCSTFQDTRAVPYWRAPATIEAALQSPGSYCQAPFSVYVHHSKIRPT